MNSGEMNKDIINDNENENRNNLINSDLHHKSSFQAKKSLLRKKKEKKNLLKPQKLEHIEENSTYIPCSKINLLSCSIIPN